MSGDYSDSNHTLTWGGSLQTQGEEAIFPGGSTDIITAADSADWLFAADFTVELFGVKFADNNVLRPIAGHWASTGNQRSWELRYQGQLGTPTLTAFFSTDGTNVALELGANFTPTVGVAYNLAFDRSGTTARLYIDGSMVDSDTLSGSLFNSNQLLNVGKGNTSLATVFGGRMRAVRITKGTARYATDTSYTVPTLPLPTQGV